MVIQGGGAWGRGPQNVRIPAFRFPNVAVVGRAGGKSFRTDDISHVEGSV